MKLNLSHLTLAYEKQIVIDNITHTFDYKKIHAIIGPNGAGKSTLIKAISGIKTPQSGTITFQHNRHIQEIKNISPRQRAKIISVVPQSSHLAGSLTVEEVISLGRTPHIPFIGTFSSQDRTIIQTLIQELDLTAFIQKPIAMLSGGEQQRVLIARALAQETPILLLDEPTNHLDLKYQTEILQQIQHINQAMQKIIIIAMHNLNIAAQIADQIILLAENKILTHGSPDQVLTPQHLTAVYGENIQLTQTKKGKTIILPNL